MSIEETKGLQAKNLKERMADIRSWQERRGFDIHNPPYPADCACYYCTYENVMCNICIHSHDGAKNLLELLRVIDAVDAIGPVHKSWNADDDFCRGWDKCMEQVREILRGEGGDG